MVVKYWNLCIVPQKKKNQKPKTLNNEALAAASGIRGIKILFFYYKNLFNIDQYDLESKCGSFNLFPREDLFFLSFSNKANNNFSNITEFI